MDRFFPQRPGASEARELAEPIPGPLSDAVAARARELSLVAVFNMYELAPDGRTITLGNDGGRRAIADHRNLEALLQQLPHVRFGAQVGGHAG